MQQLNKTSKVQTFFFVFFSFLMICWASFYVVSASFLIISLLFLSLTFFFRGNEKRLYSIVFFCNLLVIIVLYLYYIQHYGTPYFGGGSDDLSYELDAKKVVDALPVSEYFKIRGGVIKASHNSIGYIFLTSLFIRISNLIGEYHTLIPRIFNAFCLGLISILTYRIANKIDSLKRHSFLIALVVGLSPLQLYVSSHVFRDILIETIIMLVAYYGFLKKVNFLNCMIVILMVIILWELRTFSSMFAGLIYLASVFWRLKNSNSLNISLKFLIFGLAGVFIAGMSFVILPELLVDFDGYTQRYSEYRSEERSSGFAQQIFGLPLLPLGIVFRLIYLLFTPLPTFSGNDYSIFLYHLESTIRIVLIPFFLLGSYVSFKVGGIHKQILLFFFIPFFVIAATSFQARQITMYYPFMVYIFLTGFLYASRNRISNKILSLSLLTIISLSFIYLFIK